MQAAERERLNRAMSGVSANTVGVVAKCGVCLGFLALLALIGSSVNDNDTVAAGVSGADHATASAHDGVRAAAHRKLVFDERRARFEGHASELLAIEPARDGHMAIIAP